MKQLLRTLAAGFAVFVLFGAALPLAAGTTVPFRGRGEGAIINAVPRPSGVLDLTVVATGNATQLGSFLRTEELVFDPATGTLEGDISFTAANGDELWGTVAGGFIAPGIATGTYTFTGGTGRFVNASGGADFVVTTADGVHFTVEFEGLLSTVGANKK
jgi:hypothetical protein